VTGGISNIIGGPETAGTEAAESIRCS